MRAKQRAALDEDATAAQLASIRSVASQADRPTDLGALEVTVTPRGRPDRARVEPFAAVGVHRLAVLAHPRFDRDGMLASSTRPHLSSRPEPRGYGPPVATNAENAFESMKGAVGADEGVGDWFEITQDLINLFADATHDHQFIHVDPERAKSGPFGVPIAHGFLTLSLLSHLIGSVKPEKEVPQPTLTGILAGVNYGFDKVRFVSPVKVDSRIRARAVTSDVTLKDPNTVLSKRTVTVEIEGESRPAVVAEWITMLAFG